MINREAIFASLFVLVSNAANFNTKSRKLKHWAEVAPADQPALFMTQGKETAVAGYRLPTKWTLRASLYLYAHQNSLDLLPSTALNNLIGAIEAALAPGADGEQTLGLVAQTAPFARASTARQSDINGVWSSAAINQLRNAHYLLGILQPPLIEAAGQNVVHGSCLLGDSTYWGLPVGAFTLNAAASCIAGQTAWKHTCTGVGGNYSRSESTGNFVNGQTDCLYFILENVDAVTTALMIYDWTTGVNLRRVDFTWATHTVADIVGAGGKGVIDIGGGRYLVWLTGTGTAAGTGMDGHLQQAYIYPTGGTGNTKACIIHHGQMEPNATGPSSPIVTVASAVPRAADIDSMFSATATGYARQGGSFLTENFLPGMNAVPVGFASNPVSAIIGVTALSLTVADARSAESALAGRSLSFGLPIGSGSVTSCRIVGEIETDEGVLGDQAVAIIPIEIMANA